MSVGPLCTPNGGAGGYTPSLNIENLFKNLIGEPLGTHFKISNRGRQQTQVSLVAHDVAQLISHLGSGCPSDSLGEKRDQFAIKYDDVTMNTTEVPTYFMVEGESGEGRALHHVEAAEEISDVIRQARVNDDGERTWN